MEKNTALLRGPKLFADYFGRRPITFTRREVLALHREVEFKVRDIFGRIGGPELRPIIAEALPSGEFTKEVRRFVKDTSGINFSELQSYCIPVIRDGKTEWRLFYNLYNLAKVQAELAEFGVGAGNIMLSQITGTLYGNWYERLNLEARASFFQFNFASKGWGAYFSQTPHSEEGLLRDEKTDSQIFRDQSAFVTLTLLKLEKAEGFDALVKLMNNPPGLKPGPNGFVFEMTLREFWRLYITANSKLGHQNIPYEIVFSDLN
ncbi:MAG TPA: hypothetical protein VMT55_04270 [Candidatus Sulfotelmatobacter sp.]|nr:hypothetical protein [Candidatus Sulfotelmatobacter sp.]